MPFRSRLLIAIVAFLSTVPALAKPPQAEPAPSEFPWELRAHYSYPINGLTIDYDERYSRFRVRMGEDKILANDLFFAIQFADGTTWDFHSLSPAKTVRDQMNDPQIGPGTTYSTTYPLKDNVEVRYIVTVFDTRPFMTLQLEVENKGSADLRISALDPLITPPSGITGFSQATTRHFHECGGYPVCDKGSLPYMTTLSDPATNASLALGIFPEGLADSGVQLEQQGNAWHGRVQCKFEPSIKVGPGQTLASDRVAVAHGAPLKADIDLYYSWILSSLNPPKENKNGPVAWVSVADSEGLDALVSAAHAWDGVKHALVPANWEGKPGSLKGAAGRYPANIKGAADALRSAGATPGITVDPLAADGGPGDATAQSQDGQQWVNPAVPAGQDYIRKRIGSLAGDGFAFFAVAPSAIPDEALSAFGISRAQANHLAIKLVGEAVGDRPVYPAGGKAVGASAAEWAEVTTALGKLGEYAPGFGPVRLDGNGLGTLDPATAEAIQHCAAPIEVLGQPGGGGARSLAAALKAPKAESKGAPAKEAKPEKKKKKKR